MSNSHSSTQEPEPRGKAKTVSPAISPRGQKPAKGKNPVVGTYYYCRGMSWHYLRTPITNIMSATPIQMKPSAKLPLKRPLLFQSRPKQLSPKPTSGLKKRRNRVHRLHNRRPEPSRKYRCLLFTIYCNPIYYNMFMSLVVSQTEPKHQPKSKAQKDASTPSVAVNSKVQRQLERLAGEVAEELVEDVILDLCTKLASRSVQQVRRQIQIEQQQHGIFYHHSYYLIGTPNRCNPLLQRKK